MPSLRPSSLSAFADAGLAFVDDPLDRDDGARARAAREGPGAEARAHVFRRGAVLTDAAGAPALLRPQDARLAAAVERVFLGAVAGVERWAVALDPDAPADWPEEAFANLRGLAGSLDACEASLSATARGLLAWHGRHQFCANCGHPSASALAGWRRTCPNCGAEHYPRVDPVAIMLIEREGRVLLGRQASWPEGVYSCLAGFVEPGETVEGAARREAYEEAGVRLGPVTLVASQPWPFPSSLMIGVRGAALEGEARADGIEIEAVRWFDRNEIRAVLAGAHPEARTPPPQAIAHQLIRQWADENAA